MAGLSRQVGVAIEALVQAKARRGDLRLLVRIAADGAASPSALRRQALDVLGLRTIDDAVTLAFAAADEPFQPPAADFLLCTHAACGLPVELVEAMLAGLPLVTPLHTGIASLLTPDMVVPIATESAEVSEAEEPLARFLPLTCHRPTAASVCEALLAAADLSDTRRRDLGAAGRRMAERRFGLAAFRAGLAALGPAIGAA
jgi:glycosyltransferase involved in cell wall biosynthesis